MGSGGLSVGDGQRWIVYGRWGDFSTVENDRGRFVSTVYTSNTLSAMCGLVCPKKIQDEGSIRWKDPFTRSGDS